MHDLAHAIQRIHANSHDQHPGSDTCEKCSAFAQLSGTVGSASAAIEVTPPSPVTAFFSSTPAQSRTVVTSRSRAPPQFL